MKFLKWLFGITRLEKRVEQLETQVKLTMHRAQMNNMRTLMMLEHGDFPTLTNTEMGNEDNPPKS